MREEGEGGREEGRESVSYVCEYRANLWLVW